MPAPRRHVSLRTALAAGAILTVLATAAMVHIPWMVTSGANIADLRERLNGEVIASIAQRVYGLLAEAEAAQSVVRVNLVEGTVDIEQEVKREFLFLSVLDANPALSSIEFGWPDDHAFIARRLLDGTIEMEELLPQAGGSLKQRIDRYSRGDEGMLIFQQRDWTVTDYHVSRQFWFKAALDADGPIWSDIYPLPGGKALGITRAHRLEHMGDTAGIIGVTIELDRLSLFLDEIELGNGTVFLTNIYGELVAMQHAMLDEMGDGDPAMLSKIDAVDLTGPRLAAAALAQAGTTLADVTETRHFEVDDPIDGTPYFVTLSPLGAMNLSVAIVIPRSDVLGDIDRNTLRVIGIIAIFVLVMALLAVFVSRRYVARPLAAVGDNLRALEDFRLDRVRPVPSNLAEIDRLSDGTQRMATSLGSFAKFIPTELVRTLFAQGLEAKPGGETRELTILFMDLANFTRISETLGDRVIELLGDYLSEMAGLIEREKGTIDKFIGDGIMAFWNAPLPVPDHAIAACRAALACQRRLAELRASAVPGAPPLEARIGINTGDVLVGNIGSRDRLNYSAVGDPVNVASRLEALNKLYGTSIMLGEDSAARLGGRAILRQLDRVAVFGRVGGVTIYELIGLAGETTAPDWIAPYEQALIAYRARLWDEADSLFGRVLARKPGDAAARLMRDRISAFRQSPPPADWDGVAIIDRK
ncbi:MAG: adenylate/guanylate cyclase domain-containing protein [Rhodospirillaceae bacterium]|nr:adenylate/guanylate cyclase domain-containing protein [Rhodospirillaceae bacterium]